MQLNERFRKCPIKFYENPDGSIYYESTFVHGTAKNVNDAFKYFSQNDWEKDLIYYYTDVIGVKFGAFEPALKDLKRKGRKYLGKIDLQLDIDPNWGTDEHSITHLSKHPEDINNQIKFIKKMKDQEKRDKFIQNLKSGLKRVAGYFTPKTEMFDPYKTRKDLICSHCGEIIPCGTYYESYENSPYHLECIWDKLCNDNISNDYQDCREYFFSLQKYIGDWPSSGLDIQDDYESDLFLVTSNDRKIGIE